MKPNISVTRGTWIAAILLLFPMDLRAQVLVITAPLDYEIVQRDSKDKGHVTAAGKLADVDPKNLVLEARIVPGGREAEWQKLSPKFSGAAFEASMEIPAGGWFRLEMRATAAGKTIGEGFVEHVGAGEIFVVAGQSNSANHGEEKQKTQTGKVAAFDGVRWQLSNDPEPGASGNGGSFMPPLGDLMAERFGVPVGFVACGVGATSVREWMPKGEEFPSPPTLLGRVRQRPDGQWESKGQAYDNLVAKMKQLGPHGFRAVLWHQGESDANQKDPTRTLPGDLYRQYLEKIIRRSQRDIGWEAPWFVAQASYHVPGDEGSPDIRAAQASLWKDAIAFEGPDTDALKGELRQSHGKGVHFSGPGLREHAKRWFDKLAPWLDDRLK